MEWNVGTVESLLPILVTGPADLETAHNLSRTVYMRCHLIRCGVRERDRRKTEMCDNYNHLVRAPY